MENINLFCLISHSHPCVLPHRMQVDVSSKDSFKERLQFYFIKNQRSSMSVFYFPFTITNAKINYFLFTYSHKFKTLWKKIDTLKINIFLRTLVQKMRFEFNTGLKLNIVLINLKCVICSIFMWPKFVSLVECMKLLLHYYNV